MQSTARNWKIAVIGIVLPTMAWLLSALGLTYRGPGDVHWSIQPTESLVRIDYPPVDLARASTQKYAISGLPPRRMSIDFEIRDPQLGSAGLLTEFDVVMTARIRESGSGRLVCEASGSPSSRNDADRWVLWQMGHYPEAFWHRECRDVRFNPLKSYIFEIDIAPGGNEIPQRVVPSLGTERIEWL